MCAFINLGVFYVIGVPAAYLMAFVLCVGGMVLSLVSIYLFGFAEISHLFWVGYTAC